MTRITVILATAFLLLTMPTFVVSLSQGASPDEWKSSLQEFMSAAWGILAGFLASEVSHVLSEASARRKEVREALFTAQQRLVATNGDLDEVEGMLSNFADVIAVQEASSPRTMSLRVRPLRAVPESIILSTSYLNVGTNQIHNWATLVERLNLGIEQVVETNSDLRGAFLSGQLKFEDYSRAIRRCAAAAEGVVSEGQELRDHTRQTLALVQVMMAEKASSWIPSRLRRLVARRPRDLEKKIAAARARIDRECEESLREQREAKGR